MIFTDLLIYSGFNPNPLNPVLFERHALKSLYIYERLTLSWGLLGPDIQGSTVFKSKVITSPLKTGSYYDPS